jgi:molecular chaperone DnaJ
VGLIESHYQRLGVPTDADAATIRDAYRRLARIHHPDARGGRASPEMAAINEAYAVLSDPSRRLDHDRALRAGTAVRAPSSGVPGPTAEPRLDPIGRHIEPPRFPWRFVVVLVGLGTLAILVVGALTDPQQPSPADNVLMVGSCVTVDRAVGEASEVLCTDPHDGVVEALVPFDGRCPRALEAYRDRQGLGVACVRWAP